MSFFGANLTAAQERRVGLMLVLDEALKDFPDFPPGGLVPKLNFSSAYVPPSRAYEIQGVSYSLGPLAVLVVLTRFVLAKTWPGLRILAADWLMLAALACAICMMAVDLYGVHNGVGLHVWDLDLIQIIRLIRLPLPAAELYVLSTYFSKMSSLFFSRTIVPRSARRTHIAIYVLMAVQTIFTLFAALLTLLACHPVQVSWSFMARAQPYHCMNFTALGSTLSGVFLASDILFVALPIVFVFRSDMPQRSKLSAVLLFSLSIVVIAMCVAKLCYAIPLYHQYDESWRIVDTFKLTIVEVCCALILISVPALDFILIKVVPQRLVDRFRQRDGRKELKSSTSTLDPEMDKWPSEDKLAFALCLDPRNAEAKSPMTAAPKPFVVRHQDPADIEQQLSFWADDTSKSTSDASKK